MKLGTLGLLVLVGILQSYCKEVKKLHTGENQNLEFHLPECDEVKILYRNFNNGTKVSISYNLKAGGEDGPKMEGKATLPIFNFKVKEPPVVTVTPQFIHISPAIKYHPITKPGLQTLKGRVLTLSSSETVEWHMLTPGSCYSKGFAKLQGMIVVAFAALIVAVVSLMVTLTLCLHKCICSERPQVRMEGHTNVTADVLSYKRLNKAEASEKNCDDPNDLDATSEHDYDDPRHLAAKRETHNYDDPEDLVVGREHNYDDVLVDGNTHGYENKEAFAVGARNGHFNPLVHDRPMRQICNNVPVAMQEIIHERQQRDSNEDDESEPIYENV